MNKSINNPHDKFFKRAMSDLRVAKDFFQQHLPAEIKKRVAFNSLQFQKETFVDEELKLSAADVIYIANIDANPGYIYLLAEQQMAPDKWLPFRMMRYMLRLLEHHHKKYPQQTTLPLIYPCIFYNGEQHYNYSTNFFDLFGEYQKDMQLLLTSPINLIDVMTIPDNELRQYLWVGILEFVFKHRFTGDFLLYAEKTMQWLHQLEELDGYDYVKSVLHYVLEQLEGHDVEILVDIAKKNLSPKLEEETMTFAEQLIQKGIQQGMKQGLLQGEHAVLERLLKHKFKTIPGKYLDCIKTANELNLMTWAERIIDAQSLQEVFGD